MSGCRKDGLCCFCSCVTMWKSPRAALYSLPVLTLGRELSCTSGGSTQPRPWLIPTPVWAQWPCSRTGAWIGCCPSHPGQHGPVSAKCSCQHRRSPTGGPVCCSGWDPWPYLPAMGPRWRSGLWSESKALSQGPSQLPALLVMVTPPRGLPRFWGRFGFLSQGAAGWGGKWS